MKRGDLVVGPVHHVEADIAARLESPVRRGEAVPFAGLDRTGLPPVADLATFERRGLLGVTSRRSLWPELDALQDRIGELQARHGEVVERLRGMAEQRHNAPVRDADALARWELDGRRGTRPTSAVETLDAEIVAGERERDGLQAAIDLVAEQKADFVERHRRRLVNVAAQQADAAHARMVALVDELEAARASLVELRAAEIWALVYPDGAAAGEPPTNALAVGRAQPVTQALGLSPAPLLQAAGVLALLRADADALRSAATSEQRAKLGLGEAKRADTTWTDTDEGRDAQQAQERENRERIDRERTKGMHGAVWD